MSISKRIGRYMKDKGYNLSEVARKTGIEYASLYASLYSEKNDRDLRAEELIPLCIFIGVDPRDFVEDKED